MDIGFQASMLMDTILGDVYRTQILSLFLGAAILVKIWLSTGGGKLYDR